MIGSILVASILVFGSIYGISLENANTEESNINMLSTIRTNQAINKKTEFDTDYYHNEENHKILKNFKLLDNRKNNPQPQFATCVCIFQIPDLSTIICSDGTPQTQYHSAYFFSSGSGSDPYQCDIFVDGDEADKIHTSSATCRTKPTCGLPTCAGITCSGSTCGEQTCSDYPTCGGTCSFGEC